jgi:hypothetical protein
MEPVPNWHAAVHAAVLGNSTTKRRERRITPRIVSTGGAGPFGSVRRGFAKAGAAVEAASGQIPKRLN